MSDSLPSPAPSAPTAYRVLARKYRPTTFEALVGQDALVRTLRNAFQSGRIAQAYMLSGVRGIGKTTTARIIARALNCIGPDGTGGVTVAPCGVCEHCVAIAQDRHLDVIEMDAASRTGVEGMRELLDGVRYRPTSARYKVYIIDEVHMLSTHSFNALLKTLEEPPEHVKFVFATTEIRKVPVTVLSRCQRFDLRRVDAALLADHLGRIALQEGVTVEPGALHVIARAADGSVRDGLSLLDQAIAHTGEQLDEPTVRQMLGLADRTVTFDLLEAVLRGDASEALALLSNQYSAGADPATTIEDLLELTHWLTRVRVAPDLANAPGLPEVERVRGRAMAENLGIGVLSRAWQLLLKGLGEIRTAPSPIQAAEMVLIRLAYTSPLPTPAEALARLNGGGDVQADRAAAPAGSPRLQPAGPTSAAIGRAAPPSLEGRPGPGPTAATALRPVAGVPQPTPVETPATKAAPGLPASFAEVVALAGERREPLLQGHLISSVRLVSFEVGRIELALESSAPPDLPQRLSRFLGNATGRPWLVTVSTAQGEPSLRQQAQAAEAALRQQVLAHPTIAAVMATFPGTTITSIRQVNRCDEASDSAESDVDSDMEGDPFEADDA